MLQITWNGKRGVRKFTVICPFCIGSIEFFLATPPVCVHCNALIPPIYMLIDECKETARTTRLDHYTLGQKWVDGDY